MEEILFQNNFLVWYPTRLFFIYGSRIEINNCIHNKNPYTMYIKSNTILYTTVRIQNIYCFINPSQISFEKPNMTAIRIKALNQSSMIYTIYESIINWLSSTNQNLRRKLFFNQPGFCPLITCWLSLFRYYKRRLVIAL